MSQEGNNFAYRRDGSPTVCVLEIAADLQLLVVVGGVALWDELACCGLASSTAQALKSSMVPPSQELSGEIAFFSGEVNYAYRRK